jgi:hypothetical protein
VEKLKRTPSRAKPPASFQGDPSVRATGASLLRQGMLLIRFQHSSLIITPAQ